VQVFTKQGKFVMSFFVHPTPARGKEAVGDEHILLFSDGEDRSVLLTWLALFLAHGFAFEFDPVGVVHQAVQNAVGNGWVPDLFVPVCQWHLRGQDQRTALIAVITDFQEVAALGVFQWRHGEVVQQQNIGSGEPD
jgi:hypothetical protein